MHVVAWVVNVYNCEMEAILVPLKVSLSLSKSMWDFWWTAWHWDRFIWSISVFPYQLFYQWSIPKFIYLLLLIIGAMDLIASSNKQYRKVTIVTLCSTNNHCDKGAFNVVRASWELLQLGTFSVCLVKKPHFKTVQNSALWCYSNMKWTLLVNMIV